METLFFSNYATEVKIKYVDNEDLLVSSLTRYYVISPCSEY